MKKCQLAGAQGAPCPRNANCTEGRCDRTTNTCAAPGTPGSDCASSSTWECDPTSYCDSTTDKCTLLPTAGQACRTFSPRCSAALYCSGTVCQPRLAQGVSCPSSDSCETSLYCDYTLTPDSCQPRKAAGSACTSASHCAEGLRCVNQFCAAAKTAGQSCSSFSECADGLACDRVLRVCAIRVYSLQAGARCTSDTLSCDSELTCKGDAVNADGGVGTQGTCAVPVVGDPCSSRFGSDCPDQAHCNLVDAGVGTCATSALGSPCASTSQCQLTDFCQSTTCVTRKPAGESCTTSSGCAAPLDCVPAADGGEVCAARGDVGAACVSSTRFGSGGCMFPLECTNGTCQHAGGLGEQCISGLLCLAGACPNDGGACGPKVATGGDCGFSANACESGRCSGGKCEAACP